MLHMDEKQLKAINSKASKKKFNDHVLNNNVDKVNKMCAKGLDPNFHCQDSHTGGKAHYLSVSLLCNFFGQMGDGVSNLDVQNYLDFIMNYQKLSFFSKKIHNFRK